VFIYIFSIFLLGYKQFQRRKKSPILTFPQGLALKGRLVAKLEYFNPLGSVKDRIAPLR
jgi:cysteine synthase